MTGFSVTSFLSKTDIKCYDKYELKISAILIISTTRFYIEKTLLTYLCAVTVDLPVSRPTLQVLSGGEALVGRHHWPLFDGDSPCHTNQTRLQICTGGKSTQNVTI